MKEQHPIIPPPELVWEWANEEFFGMTYSVYLATRAAQWGADQELAECAEYLCDLGLPVAREGLLQLRRPKKLSQKEVALSEVAAAVAGGNITPERGAIIRLALEKLDD